MAKDLNKGISQIQYNSLNLPRIVDIKNQSVEGRNEYTYSASGQKLKVVQKWNPNYNNSLVIGSAVNTSLLTQATATDYVGNIIYENGLLKRILVEGGYYEGGNYYFYIRDHLGNNRIVANAAASVVQSTQYYPFGMPFADATGQKIQPYKYNDKELDTRNGLNMYDYSARYLDFAFPHFPTVDPLAEKYYSISPYVYVGNNPIRRVDPDGKDWIDRVAGITMGVLTNIVPGSTALRDNYTPNNSSDYNNSLRATDAAAMATGAVMLITGGAEMVAGGGTAAAGGAMAATGVGAPAGGAVAATGGTIAAKGAATALGGAVLLGNSYLNSQAGYNYGMSESGNTGGSSSGEGARRKNRLPDKGEPNTVQTNSSGTTKKKYGPDGNVQKEWNKGHSQDKNPKGMEDHIHDYKPNPYNPTGRGDRQPARNKYNNNDRRDFELY